MTASKYGDPDVQLPPIEKVASKVHEAWMEGKRANGIISCLAENGEELMVPYDQLSNAQKNQDRNTVKAVYNAITLCS
jgi:hypothetical protein